jgi:hypothetical protein
MQDGLHAQPVIPAERSNGWQTISGTEDVGPNLHFQRIGEREVCWETCRRHGGSFWEWTEGLSFGAKHLAVSASMTLDWKQGKLFWSIFYRTVSVLVG